MRLRGRKITSWSAIVLFGGFCAVHAACVAAAPPVNAANEMNAEVEEPRIALPDPNLPSLRLVAQTVSNDPLVRVVQEARESTRKRLLSTDRNSPWQIMHALLALRGDLELRHQGRVVSALDWISTGPTYGNEYWFEKTQFGGRAHPYSKPKWFEGHINQSLALMSMSGPALDHRFGVANGEFITMKDLLKNAQMTVSDKEEITWTLWALSRYLPPDAEWRNAAGEAWSIERMVKREVDKPLEGAPCGGCHQLFAIAHARNVYLRTGQPLQGVWQEAEYKIRRHIQTARMLQNSNGSLSSNFFRGREYKQDFNKRMWSAGHVLEFLMIALPQEELSEPWVRRAVEATSRDLLAHRTAEVDCSPLYHAANALSIYLERVNPEQPVRAAAAPSTTRPASTPGRTDAKTAELTNPATTQDGSATPADMSKTEEQPGSAEPQPLADEEAPALKPTPTTGTEKAAGAPTESAETDAGTAKSSADPATNMQNEPATEEPATDDPKSAVSKPLPPVAESLVSSPTRTISKTQIMPDQGRPATSSGAAGALDATPTQSVWKATPAERLRLVSDPLRIIVKPALN